MARQVFLIWAIICVWGTSAFGLDRPLKVECDLWPPYQLLESRFVRGYSTEIIRAVFKNLDQPIEIEVYPWKRALMRFREGDSDGLFTVGVSGEREQFAHYPPEPIVETEWLLWVRKMDGLKFDSWDDLRGKRVGVVRGYSYTDEFWRELDGRGSFEEAISDEINFKKLQLGRVDYVVAESGNGRYLLNKLGLDEIVSLDEKVIKRDRLHIIFNKQNVSEDFVRKFSAELKRFKNTPAFHIIENRYCGEG